MSGEVGGRFRGYPEYTDLGVGWLGEIPAHWETRRLKHCVDPLRHITHGIVQCGPNVSDGIPYIRPIDITDEGGALLDNLKRTSPEIAAAYTRSVVRPGDLVASIGPSFGKVMIVPEELSGANLTQGTARIAPSSHLDRRFLFWMLRSPETFQEWDAGCSGATFRALTLESLGETLILIPQCDEQRAIAAFLDRETAKIDALVAKKERLIELLQEKRTALITHAVTKGLDPDAPMKDSGVEWFGEKMITMIKAEHLATETRSIDKLACKVREAIDHLKEYRTALISAAVTGKIDVRGELA